MRSILLLTLLTACDGGYAVRGIVFSQGKPLTGVSARENPWYCDAEEQEDPRFSHATTDAAGTFSYFFTGAPHFEKGFMRFSKEGYETVCIAMSASDWRTDQRTFLFYPELHPTE
jgi:hypothetical protein